MAFPVPPPRGATLDPNVAFGLGCMGGVLLVVVLLGWLNDRRAARKQEQADRCALCGCCRHDHKGWRHEWTPTESW
jgi:hypothetical protein